MEDEEIRSWENLKFGIRECGDLYIKMQSLILSYSGIK